MMEMNGEGDLSLFKNVLFLLILIIVDLNIILVLEKYHKIT